MIGRKQITLRKGIGSILCIFILISCTACGGPKEVKDMSFSTEICGSIFNGTYTGTTLDGSPNGVGTFTYKDDTIEISCTGEWENGVSIKADNLQFDGMTIGYGDNTFEGLYSGEAINGSPDGNGTFKSENAEVFFEYDGQWKNGKISGKGNLKYSHYKVVFSDGTERFGEYQGETLDGLANGTGTFQTQNSFGVKYTHEGQWKEGLPHGQGSRKWEDGQSFIGNFTNGEFDPEPVDFFTAVGTYSERAYTITSETHNFIKENSDLFLENSISSYEGEIDNSFQYKVFAKNPAQYTPKVITVSGLTVVQILEEHYFEADHTFCILQDYDYNYYFVNLYGFSDNIYEGNRVTLTAVPLAYFTYPNSLGSYTWAIACAGVSLSR